MTSFLKIGLNIHMTLIIHLLAASIAFSLSIHADTARSHLLRLMMLAASSLLLVLVLWSLPHEPLF